MAAAYAVGIIKNHPFLDGNKRTGMVIALLFLELNGFECFATNEQLVEIALKIATSELSLGGLANFFVHHTFSD